MERVVSIIKKWVSYPKWAFPLSFSSASVTGLGLDAKGWPKWGSWRDVGGWCEYGFVFTHLPFLLLSLISWSFYIREKGGFHKRLQDFCLGSILARTSIASLSHRGDFVQREDAGHNWTSQTGCLSRMALLSHIIYCPWEIKLWTQVCRQMNWSWVLAHSSWKDHTDRKTLGGDKEGAGKQLFDFTWNSVMSKHINRQYDASQT